MGENIDFGPNDAIGVIVSLTLDDGEEERPHRDNLFKNDYKKIGIACGPHQTEFQMCVMDLAYDFIPKGQEQEVMTNQNIKMNNANMNQNKNLNYNKMDNNQNANQFNDYQPMNEGVQRRQIVENNNTGVQNQNIGGNEIDQLINQVKVSNANKKVVKKEVEITTKITYTYEDGSTKEINEVKKHNFEY